MKQRRQTPPTTFSTATVMGQFALASFGKVPKLIGTILRTVIAITLEESLRLAQTPVTVTIRCKKTKTKTKGLHTGESFNAHCRLITKESVKESINHLSFLVPLCVILHV